MDLCKFKQSEEIILNLLNLSRTLYYLIHEERNKLLLSKKLPPTPIDSDVEEKKENSDSGNEELKEVVKPKQRKNNPRPVKVKEEKAEELKKEEPKRTRAKKTKEPTIKIDLQPATLEV